MARSTTEEKSGQLQRCTGSASHSHRRTEPAPTEQQQEKYSIFALKRISRQNLKRGGDNTHLQKLAALLQTTLLRRGARSHMADKDACSVSTNHRDVIGQASLSMLW